MSDFVLQWEREVERVVKKWGKGRPAAFRKDMRQEAYLALLENQSKLEELVQRDPEEAGRFAYIAARNRVVSFLREEQIRTHLSIEEHEVVQLLDKLETYDDVLPEMSVAIRSAVNRLPVLERLIIQLLFGLEGLQHTETECASHLGISRRLLSDHKRKALATLRGLLRN